MKPEPEDLNAEELINNITEKELKEMVLMNLQAHLNPEEADIEKYEKSCPSCGSSLKEMARVGKFGCSECYSNFKEEILPFIRGVQKGEYRHKGKVPGTVSIKEQIELLTQQMNEAAKNEDYTKAAVCRDQIKELENKEEVNR